MRSSRSGGSRGATLGFLVEEGAGTFVPKLRIEFYWRLGGHGYVPNLCDESVRLMTGGHRTPSASCLVACDRIVARHTPLGEGSAVACNAKRVNKCRPHISSESSTVIECLQGFSTATKRMKSRRVSHSRHPTSDDSRDIRSPSTVLLQQFLKVLVWNHHPIRMMSPTVNTGSTIPGYSPSRNDPASLAGMVGSTLLER